LWDESFETWKTFGITSQPAGVLVSRNGDVIKTWKGGFPEDEVVRLATT